MKLNKKGFTLIELLAVIAIVALLAVIAIPNVMKYYNQAEVKSFIAQGQYLYKAAEQQFVQDRIKNGAYPNGRVYDNVNNPLKLQGGGDNLVYNIKVNSDGSVSYMDYNDGTWSIKVPSNGDTSLNAPITMEALTKNSVVAFGQESGGTEGGGSEGEEPTDPDIADVNPNTSNGDGTYNPNTSGIPNNEYFETIENTTDWENGCWTNEETDSGLNSNRLNCKILDDNRKCNDLTEFCSDIENHVNYYVQQSDEGINYYLPSSDNNGKGLYYTDDDRWDKTEGHRVFFYRGNVTNNYVQFAGTLWRIIRIDERGNIRMMKDEINTSASDYKTTWNTEASATYKMKMSFMYGTSSSSPYTPTNSSTIKMALDRIYGKNFNQPENQTWENFLADPGYCNDKSGDGSSSSHTTVKGESYTLYSNRTTQPTYKCNQESDNYTTNTSSFGNNANNYVYPIGLITYDEVIFAGGTTFTDNSSFYLYKPNEYWTLTPKQYNYECQYRYSDAVMKRVTTNKRYMYADYSDTPSGYFDGCDYTQTNVTPSCYTAVSKYFIETNEYYPFCNCVINTSPAKYCIYDTTQMTVGGIRYEHSYFQNYSYYTVSNKINSTVDGKTSVEGQFVNNSKYIYPVIALKPTVEFTLASETNPGTKDNPYVVGPTRTWVD